MRFILLVLVVAGCAESPKHWENINGTDRELLISDRGFCVAQAAPITWNEDARIATFLGCMQSRGWRIVSD